LDVADWMTTHHGSDLAHGLESGGCLPLIYAYHLNVATHSTSSADLTAYTSPSVTVTYSMTRLVTVETQRRCTASCYVTPHATQHARQQLLDKYSTNRTAPHVSHTVFYCCPVHDCKAATNSGRKDHQSKLQTRWKCTYCNVITIFSKQDSTKAEQNAWELPSNLWYSQWGLEHSIIHALYG